MQSFNCQKISSWFLQEAVRVNGWKLWFEAHTVSD